MRKENNLIKFSNDEQEIKKGIARSASKAGKKGGKKSARKRAERKSMKDDLNFLLSLCTDSDKETYEESEIKELAELNNVNVSAQVAVLLSQITKALHGDTKASVFLRDTVGEKPITQIEAETNIPTDKSIQEMTDWFEQTGKESRQEQKQLDDLKKENEELKKIINRMTGVKEL